MVVLLVILGFALTSGIVRWFLALTTKMLLANSDIGCHDTECVNQAASQFDAFRCAWSGKHAPWDGINRLKTIDTNGGL